MIEVQKRKNWRVICLMLVMLYFSVLPAQAQYGGGTGEPYDPYLIYTPEQMNAIGAEPNDWDNHFRLMADIDLSDFDGKDGRLPFNIIGWGDSNIDGIYGTPFTGSFDGGGHTISGFIYTSASGCCIGLFGYIAGSDAEVRNVRLVDPNITVDEGGHVGGLVGHLGEGTVSHCQTEGGTISADSNVGGLIGSCGQRGSVTYCFSNIQVVGDYSVGGLVGGNAICGEGVCVGGVVRESCSTGPVMGDENVGGLVGLNIGTISYCYSVSDATGVTNIGGLVGSNGKPTRIPHHGPRKIYNCYSSGYVSGTNETGGLVGWNGGTVSYSFWDIHTSGQNTSDGGTGKTTAEMQMANTFLEAGWDLVDEVENGPNDVWKISEGLDYPRLWWKPCKYGSGTGEPNDPYQIATVEDLMLLGESPEDYNKHFILTADIDLDPNLPGRKVFDKAVIATRVSVGRGSGGSPGSPFNGVFDGNGHTISNLTITGTENLGLFGWLASVSEVKDLGVVSVNITSSGHTIGGLVGNNDGRVTNSYSTGRITGGHVGGLVGHNSSDGTVTDCYSIATISGYSYVGGLVGGNGGSITTSYSTGAVSGYEGIGGLVGENGGENGGTITESYSAGSVTGDRSVGGLVGRNEGDVTLCYSTGMVNGDKDVGGLVGLNGGWERGYVTDCYSTGAVSGTELVGGLVGSNVWWTWTRLSLEPEPKYLITNCYSTGSVIGDFRIGGLVGDGLDEFITTCFWDIQTSGQATSAGGIGLTTAEMMDPYMLGLNGLGDDSNWILDPGRDYPRLTWEGTPGQIIPEPHIDWLEGDGTAEDPYRIDTAEKLIFLGLASSLCNRHFILDADIDLDPNLPGRQVFPQSVIPTFTGIFDGRGHTILNLTITGGKYLGLFGKLSGQVMNLGLVDVNIVGSDDYVGGLVGLNKGFVTRCYSTATISGASKVGGLVGKNDGSIAMSYSTGTVNGSEWGIGGLVGENEGITSACYSTAIVMGGSRSYVGGLVGENLGTISNCYSTGSVSGENCVGGLVGKTGYYQVEGPRIPGTILNCYSTGLVSGGRVGGLVGLYVSGTTTVSFWDIQTSGLTISDGGMGLTTAEMMDPYVLALNGFSNDPNWILDIGRDYPRLVWEGTLGQAIPDEPFIDWLDGTGTPKDPFQIENAEQLLLLHKSSLLWDKHFVLNGDIDLSPRLPGRSIFEKALIPEFEGSFVGNDHVILNLRIKGIGTLGLFGKLINGAIVRNIGLENVSVHGGSNVGGLVGINIGGYVLNCYSRGTVSGVNHVGGLVGKNDGSIATSYSTSTVTGNRHVGGLVGYNWGSITTSRSNGSVNGNMSVGGLVGCHEYREPITACYNTGTVSGIKRIGGLVGENHGPITACYNTGGISGDESVGGLVGYHFYSSSSAVSFWDIETSGQNVSTGGTGLTTDEMQMASTFLDAGWDFVDETANGTEDIWWILEGQGYPRLWWELIPEN